MKKLLVALLTVLALSCVFLVGCGKATYTVAVSVNNAEFGMVSETNIADVTEGTEIKVNGNKLTIGETEIVATPTVSDAQYTYSFVNWTAADTVDDNITITANFTRTVNNYDVTFKVDGEEYDKVSVEYGATAVLSKADPEKTGYTFKGWDASLENIIEETEVNAIFEINKYTVVFKVDGEEYDSVEVEHGATAVLSKADPEKTNYTFKGWDASLENIIEETEVNAIFEINKYTITFDMDGGKLSDGTADDIASLELDYGTAISTLDAYIIPKTGYKFVNWLYYDGNDFVDLPEDAIVENDIALKAVWMLDLSYNSLTDASNLFGYSWYGELGADKACLQVGTLTDAIYDANSDGDFGEKIEGTEEGNYVQFSVGGDNTRRFGIVIPSSRTKEDIVFLKNLGYTHLQFKVYIYYQHNAGTEFTFKSCAVLCDAKVGVTPNGTKLNIEHNKLTTVNVPIDDVISKYDNLISGDTSIFYVSASDETGDGLENSDNKVWIYISDMSFVDNSYVIENENEYYSFHNENALGEFYFFNDYTTRTIETNATYGERTDDWAKIVLNGNNWSNGISIVFPVAYTKEELQAKLDAGYTKIRIPVYLTDLEKPKTIGLCYAVGTEGEKIIVENETLTYVVRYLQDIINNYDALLASVSSKPIDQATGVCLLILYNYNGAYGTDRQTTNFNMYIGTAEFVYSEPVVEQINDYNPLLSADGIKGCSWYNEAYQGGTNVGFDGWIFDGTLVDEVDGVEGNYVRFLTSDAKNSGIQDFGIKLPSTKTLEQIQALKDEGYTKLSIKLYAYNNYAGASTYDHKNISFIAKTNDDGSTTRSALYTQSVPFNTFTTVELDIDDIIDNYTALQNGTKALVYIWNRTADYGGLDADGVENDSNLWGVYISDLQFVKDVQ